MHFSIPDTEEVKEGSTSYTIYNIYVNGVFHCKARYKQMRLFHDELKKEFGALALPEFPKKKLLALSAVEIEQRRVMLERYIQLVSQDPQMGNSSVFNTFLLTAQQESQIEEAERVSLDTFLMNGHKITISLMSTDQTEDVLEAVAQQIEIPDDFVHYFGLFLVRKEEDGDNSIVRRLQEFESPFLSLKAASKAGVHRIVLRKGYWDASYDDDLLDNKVTMNLLYVQANSDLDRQWVLATREQLAHLGNLRKKGSKREFLRLARTLKYYGYMQFKPCVTDYPQAGTRVIVASGQRELNFRVQVDGLIKEGSFKITRMRCWRITTVYPNADENSPKSSSQESQLELSFEYLMSRDHLQWISIISDQAMLMSMCLQNMVDELIMKKQGKRFKKPQDRLNVKNGGPFKQLSREHSYGVENPESPTGRKIHVRKLPEDQSAINRAMDSVKKLSGKGGQKPDQSIMENDAFEGIGDDDL
ncbi:sorting nexin-17 isoform X2 [Aplysia californica]|uniref:Sorting nexin-17 n=1 Tax=Aplysia californica TaxID=6500 RepID=A0ABM0JM07_APLCA|nr:sorting nexin-17 isoform X2 [Aplysia californica]